MSLPVGSISFSDLRAIVGPNDANPVSLSKYKPNPYAPLYSASMPYQANLSMSQFRGNSKTVYPGFTYRVFKGATYEFSAGAGGAGGPNTTGTSVAGGGGAGGILVSLNGTNINPTTQATTVNNVFQSNPSPGSGFGAGGAGAAYGVFNSRFIGGNGANGFVYFYMNGIEYFTQTSGTYTFTESGNVTVIMMGGGGSGGMGIAGGNSSSAGGGGGAGYIQMFSIPVVNSTVATITVGAASTLTYDSYYNWYTGGIGGTTSIIINSKTYSVLGGGVGNLNSGTGNIKGGEGSSSGGATSGSYVSGTWTPTNLSTTGYSGGNSGSGTKGQGTATFNRVITVNNVGGYFADDPTWFSSKVEKNIGIVVNMTTIGTSTGSAVPTDGSWSKYSVEWFGYFYATVTGTYTFYTVSVDASYVWIGTSALTGYTVSNCVVKNNGVHASKEVSGTKDLVAGTYYPIRVQYGTSTSTYAFSLSFSAPGITRTYDMTGYVYYTLGNNSLFPAESAQIIKSISSTNTDGVYYINVNGTSTATYCLMDSKWDGGGWMMLMKATNTGTTFQYTSTYWTDAGTTLNAANTNRLDGDAKFNVMNYAMIKDVLALWPGLTPKGGSITQTDSWSWMVKNYYNGTRVTPITGFSATQSRDSPGDPNTLNFAGFNSSIWSKQDGERRHVIGGGSHVSGNIITNMRWGFLWNNEAEFNSIDVVGGIGMSYSSGTKSAYYSAGDYIACCESTAGLKTSLRVELYGR